MSTPMKVLLALLIVVVLLVLAVCGGGFIWFIRQATYGAQPPQDIRVVIDAPSHVDPGASFEVPVRIFNDAEDRQTLDSIDVFADYLAGIDLRRSEPAWRQSSNYGDFLSYDFQLDLPPSAETTITFHAVALSEGDWVGDFDVCVNGPASCSTHAARTIVGTPAPGLGNADEFAPPRDVEIAVRTDDPIAAGARFRVTVEIRNDADFAQSLDSIDVEDSWLDGLRIEASRPPWSGRETYPGFESFAYGIELPAGTLRTVVFEAIGDDPGSWRGDFDVCINTGTSCETTVVATTVHDAP